MSVSLPPRLLSFFFTNERSMNDIFLLFSSSSSFFFPYEHKHIPHLLALSPSLLLFSNANSFIFVPPSPNPHLTSALAMDKLSVNSMFLSAASANPVRRLSLVPPFTKTTPSSSPTSTPSSLRRKSMVEAPAVSVTPRTNSLSQNHVTLDYAADTCRVLTGELLDGLFDILPPPVFRWPKLDAKPKRSAMPSTPSWNGNARKFARTFERR